MPLSTSALDVFGRTRQVAAYQQARYLDRRPVLLMLAGALLAAVSAVLCGLLCYQIWYERQVPPETGLFGVSLLFAFFAGGAYIFALAYELYDVGRALRFTLVLALLGVLALAFMIGVLVVLATIKAGSGIALSERQGRQMFGALHVLDGDSEDEAATEPEPNPHFSLITCKSCDRQFFPVPPTAICPWCDTAYLTA